MIGSTSASFRTPDFIDQPKPFSSFNPRFQGCQHALRPDDRFYPCPSGTDLSILWSPFRALPTVFVPVFCPSRFHLPAFLCSTGITPFLRSYEGSVAFRVRFFGPSAGHERRSFPEERSLIHVAPTSCHSITTHPMHSFSCAHCLAAGRGRRSCLALHGSASGSGLRSSYASSPMHQAVSCSTLFYLWTGSSSPVASHPVSRRRSYLRLRTASVLSDGDFHPIVGAHSQAHVGRGSRRAVLARDFCSEEAPRRKGSSLADEARRRRINNSYGAAATIPMG